MDDDDDIAGLLLMGLERADISAVRASNGEEGVDAVLRERPRVVLLDWMMPVMDGIRACEKIRAERGIEQPRILMLTARTQTEDQCRARESGVDAVIPKPFRPRAVVAQVREIMGADWGFPLSSVPAP
ncbi:response regulator transcription factor [uncultured Microbacterium sp.]|uniref:response regulator transcription factor n=1 Tax=uncultured Microbacterium sp. TaxID=191216 RepID=UPI0025FAD872|nr:response regulator transcription factor [uncultured Microbacterium sp.]